MESPPFDLGKISRICLKMVFLHQIGYKMVQKVLKMYHTGVKLDFVENIFAGKNITEFDLTHSQSQCQGQQQMCMFVVVCCLISSTIRKIKQPLVKTYILFHITQTLLTSQ